MPQHDTASGRYSHLETFRSPFLGRGREGARLTIPHVLPPHGGPTSGTQRLWTPFQSVGAKGVNNLASKLLLALFPPGEPFFRLALDDFVVQELAQQGGVGGDARGKMEQALNRIERAIKNRMEIVGVRTSIFEAVRHLIITGNGLFFMGKAGKLRFFRLDEYVVKRDPAGEVLEIITKQMLSLANLPDKILPLVQRPEQTDESKSAEDTIPLFTWVRRTEGGWEVHQEVEDKTVPDSEGTYPMEKSPWLPLRWGKVDNEDYGRGHVEEYIGDLMSLESLTQSLVEGSAAAAKVLFLVRPGGVTTKKKVADAASGAIINGVADDITVLQLNKFADFQVAENTANKIERRLSAAFLLSSTVVRDAERVTAEEVRIVAGELEDTLGGIYSLLSQELQLPLVRRMMFEMERAKELPALPKEAVQPQIVTGLEALRRRHDLDKLDIFINRVGTLVGPDKVGQFMHPGPIIKRMGTALGIDMDGVVKTEQEIQAELQAQRQAELAQRLGPNAITEGGKTLRAASEEQTKGA